jgi:hypothetical protein
MKTLMFVAALLASTATIAPALSAEPQLPEIPLVVRPQVKADLGMEAAECTAYYNFAAAITERDFPNNSEIPKVKTAAELAAMTAMMLVDKDVALANVKLAYENMQRTMGDGTPGKFSIVVAEYSQKCKTLLEDPASRVAYWVKVENDALAATKTHTQDEAWYVVGQSKNCNPIEEFALPPGLDTPPFIAKDGALVHDPDKLLWFLNKHLSNMGWVDFTHKFPNTVPRTDRVFRDSQGNYATFKKGHQRCIDALKSLNQK